MLTARVDSYHNWHYSQVTGEPHRAWSLRVCVCVFVVCLYVFSVDMQGGRMYHPIKVISVTALNIFNSKDDMGAGEGGVCGAESPCRSCLFSRFALLPGVWHWLELEMNVAYGNPWNWPTPGSPSFLQWKFPFSKPISCRGRTTEQPICQQWQWNRKTFSSPCITTAFTQTQSL